MRFEEIASRVTGFSTPVFGVSWQPPEPEIVAARRVIAFLEDRRVLYVPSEMEVPHHCVMSVMEIRHFLTQELGALGDQSGLHRSLRAMRAACRKFLDEVGAQDGDIVRYGGHHNHWASWQFNGALGELRGVFGLQLARIATEYGLDIEDELARILPGADDEGPLDA
ncbi:MAG: hypothetical protein LLG24_00990 [Actinomycetia bacterium]|nr:hypothetical protein [Actinomycetes bacterium]